MFDKLEEIFLILNNLFKKSISHTDNIKLQAELYKNKDWILDELDKAINKYDIILQELKNEI